MLPPGRWTACSRLGPAWPAVGEHQGEPQPPSAWPDGVLTWWPQGLQPAAHRCAGQADHYLALDVGLCWPPGLLWKPSRRSLKLGGDSGCRPWAGNGGWGLPNELPLSGVGENSRCPHDSIITPCHSATEPGPFSSCWGSHRHSQCPQSPEPWPAPSSPGTGGSTPRGLRDEPGRQHGVDTGCVWLAWGSAGPEDEWGRETRPTLGPCVPGLSAAQLTGIGAKM